MSTPHLDPFRHYPKLTILGLSFIGIAGALFIAAMLNLESNQAAIASDLAGILVLGGLWVFFIIGAKVERRKKYAALLILIFGLFLLSVTASLPLLIGDILQAAAMK